MLTFDITKLVNPYYAAREQIESPIMARIPKAPKNMSPVPHLTSLYHNHEAGDYGNRSYPGNCGGNIIRDLLRFFEPNSVFDPMSGSGTCRDVCSELDIPCTSSDLRQGIDACSSSGFPIDEEFDFIWSHPPYWRQKIYSNSPYDLSQAESLEIFTQRYRQFIRNCAKVLKPRRHFAVLMGDYYDREVGYVPLTYLTKKLAFEAGLSQACTDIIRFSHGASSSRKVYRSVFIPGLHDTCMIFLKK